MKLQLFCAQCTRENHKSISSLVELNDNGLYKFICPKGHETITLLQQQKFELLCDIGVNAIIDGYYREAVSSFTASMERFFEFFIQVFSLKSGINYSVFKDTWKLVSNQSERQLGAFIYFYSLEFGKPPVLLNNKMIHFRNEVIHKGKIPNRNEAIEYGQNVLDLIQPLIKYLLNNNEEFVHESVTNHLSECHKSEYSSIPTSTLCLSTIIDISISKTTQPDRINLSEILKRRRFYA